MSISGNLGIYAAAFAFHLLAILACAEDKRVLLISIDGVRADALEIADAPNLRGLYENGAGFYSRGFVEDATITGPSWSTIWHGVHRDVHRVNTSRDYGDADFISAPNFLHRLKRFNPQWRTAAFYTWGAFGDNFVDPALVDSPPLIEYNHRHRPHTPEQIALIKQSGIDYFAFWPYRRGGDERITEAAVKVLTTGNPQVVMFYLADPDAAGHDHGFGPNIEPYMDQIRISDKLVGRVLNSLRNRPGVLNRSEQWLIMVVSDHGGGIDGRHEFNRFGEREVPFIIHGPGVVTDAPSVKPKAVDVVPTLLAYMNVPAKAAGLLHGRPIGLSPCPDPQLGYGINLIFNGDAEFDHGFHSQEFDQAISGWNDQNMTGDKDGWHSMTVMRYGSAEGYPTHDDPAPAEPGFNLFVGGSMGNESVITQMLDLTPLRDDITAGNVRYTLSAYLGGSGSSNDRAEFIARFYDAQGNLIETAHLPPVTNVDRNNLTGLLRRDTQGTIPADTTSMKFELRAVGDKAPIQAFADQLSFVLEQPKR